MVQGKQFRILKKERLTPVTNRFVLEAPWIAQSARPGQFVIVRVSEFGERIPVTIADSDAAKGTVTVVVQEVGRTSKLFGALQENQALLDLVGPLGEPFRLMREKFVTPQPFSARQEAGSAQSAESSGPEKGSRVIGIGGGFGAAALYPLMRMLHQRGIRTEAVVGARTREFLILEEELSRVCSQVMPCTDDGSYGFKGFVTDRLKLRLDELKGSTLAEGSGLGAQGSCPEPTAPSPELTSALDGVEVVAVGPMPMMRAVATLTAQYKVPTQVSLDPIMIDGTGMCGGCRVTVGGEVKFACVDGPMFDAHQVDFGELVRRNKMYAREEAALNAA